MRWLSADSSLTDRSPAQPAIPARLLRQLFAGRRLGIGSRVLDVGCGRGELLRFMDDSGVDAVGLDESSDNVLHCRRRSPHLACLVGSPSRPLPFPEHAFNVVLARNLPEHSSDLLGRPALCATARLLATVRPGGVLCVIRQLHDGDRRGPQMTDDHGPGCYRQHLEAFCTGPRLSREGEGWTWFTWFRPRFPYLTATLTVPTDPRRLNDWLRIALKHAHRQKSSCCPAGDAHSLRHAATLRIA